jgi:hypothetical protein
MNLARTVALVPVPVAGAVATFITGGSDAMLPPVQAPLAQTERTDTAKTKADALVLRQAQGAGPTVILPTSLER